MSAHVSIAAQPEQAEVTPRVLDVRVGGRMVTFEQRDFADTLEPEFPGGISDGDSWVLVGIADDERDDHVWVDPGSGSLEAIRAAIEALEVVADQLAIIDRRNRDAELAS